MVTIGMVLDSRRPSSWRDEEGKVILSRSRDEAKKILSDLLADISSSRNTIHRFFTFSAHHIRYLDHSDVILTLKTERIVLITCISSSSSLYIFICTDFQL